VEKSLEYFQKTTYKDINVKGIINTLKIIVGNQGIIMIYEKY